MSTPSSAGDTPKSLHQVGGHHGVHGAQQIGQEIAAGKREQGKKDGPSRNCHWIVLCF